MAPRHTGDEPPQEGTPEYDWLYGTKGKGTSDDATQVIRGGGARPNAGPARPGASEPEHTRVMPAAPAPTPRSAPSGPSGPKGRSAPRGDGRPPSGPPPGRGAASSARPRRPRRIGFRVVKLVIAVWLIFLIAVPLWAWNNVAKVDAMPEGERPADQPGTTYLLVGSDSRDELSEAERKELGTGGPVGRRTDTIMLLHTGDGPNLLMSIPRDSIVDIPGHSRTKINAAYAWGGPQLLIKTLEQSTGIRIDHYVEIGFGGFVGAVDAVGGIQICPEEAMKDPDANLNIKKGCQEADGKTALGYARSRKTSALGDIDRARRQREVVSAVGSKALSPWSIINPLRYVGLADAGSSSVVISEGTGPVALGRFAFAMTRVDGEKGMTCGVPISDLAVNWDSQRAPELFEHIIADDTAGIPNQLCTPSGMPQ